MAELKEAASVGGLFHIRPILRYRRWHIPDMARCPT
jgi:hypothetical protein